VSVAGGRAEGPDFVGHAVRGTSHSGLLERTVAFEVDGTTPDATNGAPDPYAASKPASELRSLS